MQLGFLGGGVKFEEEIAFGCLRPVFKADLADYSSKLCRNQRALNGGNGANRGTDGCPIFFLHDRARYRSGRHGPRHRRQFIELKHLNVCDHKNEAKHRKNRGHDRSF